MSYQKEVKKVIRLWDFAKQNCVFLTKFGVEYEHGKLELYHGVNFKNEEDRRKYGDMRLLLLVVNHKGHLDIMSQLEAKSNDVFREISGKGNVEFDVMYHLMEDTTHYLHTRFTNPAHLYYFYACDSLQQITNTYKRYEEDKTKESQANYSHNMLLSPFETLALTLRLTLTDSYDQHHSAEERHTGKITAFFFIVEIFLIIYIIAKIRTFARRNEELDHPLVLVAVIEVLMALSLLSKFAHFWAFSKSGQNLELFDICAKIFFMASDGLLCLFFLMMSKGWGVSKIHLVFDYELELVLGILLLVARYAWVLVGHFVQKGDDDIFHMYNGVCGKLELFNLLVFYLWFVISLGQSALFAQPKYENLKKMLHFLGVVNYVVRPVLVILAEGVAVHNQHQYALVVTLGTNVLACALLSFIFTKERGTYMRVSISNGIELAGDTRLQ